MPLQLPPGRGLDVAPEIVGQFQQEAFKSLGRCEAATVEVDRYFVQLVQRIASVVDVTALAQDFECLLVAQTNVLGHLGGGVPANVIGAQADADVVFVTFVRHVVLDGGECRLGDVGGRFRRRDYQLAVAELNVDQQPFQFAGNPCWAQVPREPDAAIVGRDWLVEGELADNIRVENELMFQ